MKNGFEFELSDGTVIQVVPDKKVEICSVSHGDTKIELKPSTGSFRLIPPKKKRLADIPHVTRFENKKLTVTDILVAKVPKGAPHIMRNCILCGGGRWCCVSGGCVNCGCGWICGAPK